MKELRPTQNIGNGQQWIPIPDLVSPLSQEGKPKFQFQFYGKKHGMPLSQLMRMLSGAKDAEGLVDTVSEHRDLETGRGDGRQSAEGSHLRSR